MNSPRQPINELIHADKVHRDIYTDPHLFELEMERIFEKTWVFLGHETEIPAAGDYKTTAIGRQPVIVNRDKNGEIHVFMNRCMHRGAMLCREERGNVDYHQCIYHGWVYNHKGELTGIPYRSGYEGIDMSALSLLRAPRVEIYRGFIFASLESEGDSLFEWLGAAKTYLDNIVDPAPDGTITVAPGTQKYTFPSNWKLQIENWLDGYHPSFVHQTAFDIRVERHAGEAGTKEGVGAKTISFAHGHGVLDYTGVRKGLWGKEAGLSQAYVAALTQSRGAGEARRLLAELFQVFVFPNLFIQKDRQHYRVLRPVSVNQTEVYAYPYVLNGAPEDLNGLMVKHLPWWTSATGFAQPDDVEAFVRCQEGFKVSVKGAEWIFLNRGLHREIQSAEGAVIGDISDEVTQRGIYREWKRLMSLAET